MAESETTRIRKSKREDARGRGDKTFDPGAPCQHGHRSPRYTANDICVACKRRTSDAYYAANSEARLAYSRSYHESHPEKARERGVKHYRQEHAKALARAARWREAHRVEIRASKHAHRSLNLIAYRERERLKRQSNPEPARARVRLWQLANPDKARAASAAYHRAHPESAVEHATRRKARKLGATVGCRASLAAFVKWSRTARSVRCYWCGATTKPGRRHNDHIIPLSRGGSHTVGNLCVACPRCNLTKHAKMPEEFAGQSEMALT